MFRTLALSLISLASLLGLSTVNAASSFSTMSVDEVSVLLDAAPAKGAAGPNISILPGSAKTAVGLTAEDMVLKVYGVLDQCNSMQECMDQSRARHLTPEAEDDVLWLEPSGGYFVDYYGRYPRVSALARFADGPENPVSDFGYFFLFPYNGSDDKSSIDSQADFTSLFLQELTDMGVPMMTRAGDADTLFDAIGDYEGNMIDVRLLDDRRDDGAGRYILIVSVEPNAYTDADALPAL